MSLYHAAFGLGRKVLSLLVLNLQICFLQKWHRWACKPGKIYRKTHYQLTVLYELLMGTATWPAGAFKAALNLIGQPAGVPRDPVLQATDADIDKIKRCFDNLGIHHI